MSDRGGGADTVIRSIGGEDFAVWLDVAMIQGLTNGAKVTSWTPTIGTGPVQGDATKQPIYRPVGFNGHPAVQFDNSNDCLAWTSGQLNSGGTEKCTIASVGNTASTSANSVIFEVGAAYWAGRYAAQFYNTSEKGVSAEGPGGTEGSVTVVTEKDNVFISAFDRGTNPDTIVSYINGEPATPAAETTTNNTDTFLWNTGANLGARNNGSSLPLNGDLREFIIINRLLSEEESCRLGKALMNKCGLTEQYVA